MNNINFLIGTVVVACIDFCGIDFILVVFCIKK